jgi:hypothetical protein
MIEKLFAVISNTPKSNIFDLEEYLEWQKRQMSQLFTAYSKILISTSGIRTSSRTLSSMAKSGFGRFSKGWSGT